MITLDKLFDSIEKGRKDILENFLKSSGNPNETTNANYSLLHCAAQYDNIEAARILIAAKANKDLKAHDGATAYHLATSDEMKDLLDHGPNSLKAIIGDIQLLLPKNENTENDGKPSGPKP